MPNVTTVCLFVSSGDRLLRVNGQEVTGMSPSEADSLLKSIPRGKVSLVLLPAVLVPAGDGDGADVSDGNALSLSSSSSGLGSSISTMAKSLSNSSMSAAAAASSDPEEGVIQFEVIPVRSREIERERKVDRQTSTHRLRLEHLQRLHSTFFFLGRSSKSHINSSLMNGLCQVKRKTCLPNTQSTQKLINFRR